MSDQESTATSSNSRLASLIGFHGYENAGDDAFCLVLAKWASRSLDIDKLLVSGADKEMPRTPLAEPLKITGVEPEQQGGRIRRFLREPTHLINKDVVIFGAGSIFACRRFWWLAVQLWVVRVLRWCRLINTRLAAVGISIGPFKRRGDSFWCRQALRQFDVVTVRDQASWHIGTAYGLKNLRSSYDLALAMPNFFQIPQHDSKLVSSEETVIGFSVVDRDAFLGKPEVDDAKRKALVEALIEIARQNSAVKFRGFNFCKNPQRGDQEATEKITAALRAAGCRVEIVQYENDPLQLMAEIAGVHVMICNRMHSFVFSCLTQTPAVMLSYAPKMSEYANLLEIPERLRFSHCDLNSQRLECTLNSLLDAPMPPCDPQVLSQCSANLLADLENAAAKLRHHEYRYSSTRDSESTPPILRRRRSVKLH